MSKTENPQVVSLLWGHTNENNAYVIEDYPYGSLRTKMKVWVETAEKGSGKGQQRYVSQTLNPKTQRWNKPHCGIYCQKIYLYLDQQGHVQQFAYSSVFYDEVYCRLIYSGLYDKLPQEEKDYWDSFVNYLNRKQPDSWKKLQNLLTLIRNFYQNGQTFDLANKNDCYQHACSELGYMLEKTFDQAYNLVKYERLHIPLELVYS